MAKKVVKKKVTPKKVAKKISKKIVRRAPAEIKGSLAKREVTAGEKRSWRSLIAFTALLIVTYVLYLVSEVPIYEDLFLVIGMLLGAICMALIISLLVFLFYSKIKLRRIRKK